MQTERQRNHHAGRGFNACVGTKDGCNEVEHQEQAIGPHCVKKNQQNACGDMVNYMTLATNLLKEQHCFTLVSKIREMTRADNSSTFLW